MTYHRGVHRVLFDRALLILFWYPINPQPNNKCSANSLVAPGKSPFGTLLIPFWCPVNPLSVPC